MWEQQEKERETNQRRGERKERAWEPTASSLRQGDWPERRESTKGLAGASLGRQLALKEWVVSRVPAPPVNQAWEKGLKQVSLHSILLFASRASLFRAGGERKTLISELISFEKVLDFSSKCWRFKSRVSKEERSCRKVTVSQAENQPEHGDCSTLRCRFCCPKLALKF